MQLQVRPAGAADLAALAALDRAIWSPVHSPGPPPEGPFDTDDRDVLVAVVGDAVAGYVATGPATPLASSAHNVLVNGLAVDPAHRGSGVATALLEGAVARARADGARKVSLRVLGHNTAARRLYEQLGFVVEGVLRDEFLLDGELVDDVLMARHLADVPATGDK